MKTLINASVAMALSFTVQMSFAADNYGYYGRGYGNPSQKQQLRVDRMLSRFDINQDEQITLDEVQALHTNLFAQSDVDGNGVLNLTELQNLMAMRRQQGFGGRKGGRGRGQGGNNPSCPRLGMNGTDWSQKRFARFDNDQNGQITLMEFTTNIPLFNRFDRDNNGVVTKAELSQMPRSW